MRSGKSHACLRFALSLRWHYPDSGSMGVISAAVSGSTPWRAPDYRPRGGIGQAARRKGASVSIRLGQNVSCLCHAIGLTNPGGKLSSMSDFEPIAVKGRKIRLHKAITNPLFGKRTVLTNNPWTFVDLWLRREGKSTATFTGSRPRIFTARRMGFRCSPLHYYCIIHS